MCFIHSSDLCPYPQTRYGEQLQRFLPLAALLLIFIFSPLVPQLYAQVRSEEYQALKNWKLPENAVPSAELIQDGELYTHQGLPFSGIAYSNYPDGNLLRAVSYQKGLQDGLMLLWYPDGAPQMSANYRNGVLHGRFLGWYLNGGMIYDMMINRGTYAGDSLAEEDQSRAASEGEDSEREGPDNDQSPE